MSVCLSVAERRERDIYVGLYIYSHYTPDGKEDKDQRYNFSERIIMTDELSVKGGRRGGATTTAPGWQPHWGGSLTKLHGA